MNTNEFILIVGGAGYIGSHVNRKLVELGYKTLILDNLSAGHFETIQKDQQFVLADLKNIDSLKLVFEKYNIIAVMHFGAVLDVGESVQKPEKYFYNNVVNSLNLLHVMREFEVKHFIFSSTAAVYGNPQYIPIDEKHPLLPLNPYGKTKHHIEEVLSSYSDAYNFKFVALRYFNAAGASLDSSIGENHNPETHLIPLVLDTAIGKRERINIYGGEHDTKDGTAIRDYIHVEDLATAHILSLQYLLKGGKSEIFNVGNEVGYSVKEVIDIARKVTNMKISSKVVEPRAGDASVLIADSSKIKEILNWKPEHSDIETIISTAWNWHKKLNSLLL
jgi:UDP-glucose 4-epimerase